MAVSLCVSLSFQLIHIGGSRILRMREPTDRGRGAPTYYLANFCENCIKMKKFWLRGEGELFLALPCRSTIHLVSIFFLFLCIISDFSHWRISAKNRSQRKHPGSTKVSVFPFKLFNVILSSLFTMMSYQVNE